MSSSRRRGIAWILLALSAGAGCWALFLAIRLHPEKLQLADLSREGTSLRIRIEQLEAEARQVDRLRREAAAVTARKVQTRPAPLATPDQKKSQQDLIRLIHNHPLVEAKYAVAEKAALGVLYRPLFHALKLSGDQESQVLAALVGRAQGLLDLEAKALRAGQTTSDPDVEAEAAEQNLASATALKTLLGADGYQQFQDYETTVNIRLVVGSLANNTYYDHPLTVDQSDRLVAALGIAVPTSSPVDPLLVDRGPPGTDWDAATGAAADVLDSDQLATFRILATLNKEGRMN